MMYISNRFLFFTGFLFAGMFFAPRSFLETKVTGQEKAREEVIKQYRLSPGSEAKIANIPFGAVLILPVDTDTAEIRILRTASTQAELACNKIKIDGSSTSLTVTGNNNSDCRLQNTAIGQNVVIKLPRKVNIKASSITGPLRIGEIEGRGPNYVSDGKGNKVPQPADREDVIGKGFEGSINIQGVSGAVKLVQGTGYSNISGVSGPIEITIRSLGKQGITVDGTNNTVEINLGADINSILEINDIRGRIVNNAGVALDTKGKKSRSQIGSGGAVISISNVNGDVIVTKLQQ
jgi:hypothetical protein